MSSLAVFCVIAAASVLQPTLADVDVDVNLDASNPDFDLESVEKAFPEFHTGLVKYGRHFQHSKSRKPILLKHGHNVHHRHYVSLDSDSDADIVDKSLEMPLRLPGRHPSVEKALDGMSGDLEILKEKKVAATEARGDLEGTVSDAVHHMNDQMSIKRAMAKKESQLRIESGKLQALEQDAGRLEETHNSLVSSLHRMLEPKLLFARQRFEKREMVLRREEHAARAWKEKQDQIKDSAMELIKQKKAAYQVLLQAEAASAQAKKQEELARIEYKHIQAKTAEQVQSYHYAETRYKAEVQHEKNAQANAMAARDSVEKLHNVANREQEKVDQSILFRKDRLRRKIQEIQGERVKSSHELSDLEQQYKDWQEMQRERTAEVVRKGQETAVASDVYGRQQQQVLDSASAKVVHDAEAVGDWDGWGGWAPKVTDEDDE